MSSFVSASKMSVLLLQETAGKLAKLTRIVLHFSEIRGLRSAKCSNETLQNLLHFMYKKTHVVFFVFH